MSKSRWSRTNIFLKGHVAWYSDYHEYFEIDNGSTASTTVTFRH
jgi:hypothetical protein